MTMDHAVALLSQYGQDALMAKIDLKAAFRLIPVQAADWVHLGICWRGQFYVDIKTAATCVSMSRFTKHHYRYL